MRRSACRLVFACLLIAAPAVLAADDTPFTDTDLRAAYCSGFDDAQEAAIGDVCIEAAAGWENGCSAIVRQKNRSLAYLQADNAISRAGVNTAIVSGQNDFKQCIGAAGSDAEPACKRLRACDD